MQNDTQPTKMWSGRFREPLNPAFESWQRSFPFDVRLLTHEIAASKAHAQAIAAAGILTPDELARMLEGLDGVVPLSLREGAQLTNADLLAEAYRQHMPGTAFKISASDAMVALNPHAEDIHHFVELQLTKLLGPLALKLHTGRSRNEQIATDMRLFVRDAIDQILAGLRSWSEALLDLAEASGGAVMPSYTHLQRAEPVLVAHWLLAYVSMLNRDLSRFTDARERMNFCPLGSGAIAGATLALDRHIAAKALAFTAPTPNSMDATSDRHFMLDFTQACSTLGLHISRFAEELTLHATAEFGFLDLPEAFSTGSSAMPQKKNPDLTELIRGKSARLLGSAVTLATLIKGLPLAYNKDLQEGQEPVFDAADTTTGMLALLPDFTRALRFRTAVQKAAAETGYLNAMAAATYLVHQGTPFRLAHEHVGHAVRFALERGVELNDLSLADLQQFSPYMDQGYLDACSLASTLAAHDVPGGTAPARVQQALADLQSRLAAHEQAEANEVTSVR